MKFKIDLSPGNYWKAVKALRRKQRQASELRHVRRATYAVIGLFFFSLFAVMMFDPPSECCSLLSFIGLLPIVSFVLLVVVMSWASYVTRNYVIEKSSGGVGELEIELTEKGIHERSALSQHFYKWEGVSGTEKDGDLLYLFVEGDRAVVIVLDQLEDAERSAVMAFAKSAVVGGSK